MEDEQAQLLLRMPLQLKNQLQKEANLQGRKLTQEINIRLRVSLAAHGATLQGVLAREAFPKPAEFPVHKVEQERAPYGSADVSELDKAMLAVFRGMPVEKQLALLSLFK